MMDRTQRISFEILDCALNRATHRGGCAVNVAKFVGRLRQQLYPDIEAFEFSRACKSLAAENALDLRLLTRGGQRIYEGKEDDVFFADNASLLLGPAPLSYARFRRLSALIEAPAGIRRPRERRDA